MKLRGVAFLSAIGLTLSAQTPTLQFGVVYVCPAVNASLKVYSCAGPGNADACDVESHMAGQPAQRGKSPRQQVMTLLSVCHVQTPAEAQAGARGGAAAAQAAAQTGAGGFKVGDTVQISTGFGWIDGKVLRVNGNQYFVHSQNGGDVWKSYPSELRGTGPATAQDRAFGRYDSTTKCKSTSKANGPMARSLPARDRSIKSNCRAIALPGPPLRTCGSLAPRPLHPQASRPARHPSRGLTSCAGKIEGRYASSAGFGGATFVFRSGKVTITGPLVDPEEAECWMGGGKIILHKPGQNSEMDIPLDINKDGTLDTPFGEVKKKGD